MIEFINNLWAVITIPLAWLPDYCQVVLGIIGTAVCTIAILLIMAKLAALAFSFFK